MLNLAYLPLVLTALAFPVPVHAENAEQSSSRAYCTRTGGQVQETGSRSVYICCYPDRQKCVVSDTGQRLSWIVPLQPNTPEATTVINLE